MEESAFTRWMRDRMGELGLNQTELAKAAGFPSQSAISNILLGKRRVKIDERLKIEKALGQDGPADEKPSVVMVPVIGIASAGVWREAVQIPGYTMPMRKVPGRNMLFAVEVDGDSMNLLLPEGGWAAVDPDSRALYEMKVYLISNGEGDATIKRYRNNPARFEPVSNNTDHQTIFMHEHEIRVIGRIVSYGNDQGL